MGGASVYPLGCSIDSNQRKCNLCLLNLHLCYAKCILNLTYRKSLTMFYISILWDPLINRWHLGSHHDHLNSIPRCCDYLCLLCLLMELYINSPFNWINLVWTSQWEFDLNYLLSWVMHQYLSHGRLIIFLRLSLIPTKKLMFFILLSGVRRRNRLSHISMLKLNSTLNSPLLLLPSKPPSPPLCSFSIYRMLIISLSFYYVEKHTLLLRWGRSLCG